MPQSHSVAVFGATGLVGRACLKLLLDRPEFSRVVVGVRRQLSLVPRKYKPVHVHDVARTLVNAAVAERAGVQIIESQSIERAASTLM